MRFTCFKKILFLIDSSIGNISWGSKRGFIFKIQLTSGMQWDCFTILLLKEMCGETHSISIGEQICGVQFWTISHIILFIWSFYTLKGTSNRGLWGSWPDKVSSPFGWTCMPSRFPWNKTMMCSNKKNTEKGRHNWTFYSHFRYKSRISSLLAFLFAFSFSFFPFFWLLLVVVLVGG